MKPAADNNHLTPTSAACKKDGIILHLHLLGIHPKELVSWGIRNGLIKRPKAKSCPPPPPEPKKDFLSTVKYQDDIRQALSP